MAQKSRAEKARVYTTLDDEMGRALRTANTAGLVSEHASRSERLRALALYADRRLTEEKEREGKLAAYRALAEDEERLSVIDAATRVAVEHGLL